MQKALFAVTMLENIAINPSISQCNKTSTLKVLYEQLLKVDWGQTTEANVREATKSLAILAYQLHVQCQQQLSDQLQPNQQTCHNHTNEPSKNSWQKIKLLAQLHHNSVNVAKKAIVLAKEVITKNNSIAIIQLVAQNLEELAFVLWQHHSLPRNCSIYHDFPPHLADEVDSPVRSLVKAKAAARVDLAGGWSDTPPITYQCLQPKPAVLNVAVRKPIECCCSWLNYADFKGIYILVDSLQPGQRSVIHYSSAKQVYENYCLPLQPGSLICAIVIASGLILKQGIKRKYDGYAFNFKNKARAILLEVHSALPHGSGMGTSSILSGALLACLWRLQAKQYTQSDIIQTVLKIEQMHTTCGGWQDQVGGLIPSGFKLASLDDSKQVVWKTVNLPVELANKFEERLALVYTGTTRLAKNLLQQVVLSWLRGDDGIQKVVAQLSDGAVQAAAVLEEGHFPVAQLEQYNKLKNAFASNTETLLVEQLRQHLAQLQLATVSWVAGAGGGGFLYVLLAEHTSIDDLREFLKSHKEYCDLTVSCVNIDYDPLEIHCF